MNTITANTTRIEHRNGFFARLFGLDGWYIVSPNGKSGPFKDEQTAGEVAFYDRYYG